MLKWLKSRGPALHEAVAICMVIGALVGCSSAGGQTTMGAGVGGSGGAGMVEDASGGGGGAGGGIGGSGGAEPMGGRGGTDVGSSASGTGGKSGASSVSGMGGMGASGMGGTSGSGGVGGAGAGGTLPDGGVGAPTVTVDYPFLLVASDSTRWFPTAFAHLLGQQLAWNEVSTDLACFRIQGTSVSDTVALHAELPGYNASVDKSISVPANTIVTSCLSPAVAASQLDALYALSAPIPGSVHVTAVRQSSGTKLLDDTVNIRFTTGQTAFNGKRNGAGWTLLYKYQAVFAMPKNAKVQSLLAELASLSRWGTFGVGGYDMHGAGAQRQPMAAVTQTIERGSFVGDLAYFEAGESIAIVVDSVSCTACASQTIDLYVMSDASFQTFAQAPCAGGVSVIANAENSPTGTTITATAAVAGWYWIALRNSCANLTARTVSFRRLGTRADTALDVLQATYRHLKTRGITYVNVASSFFDPSSSQTVRWPPTSLVDNAANCVDGSMLFASVLEAVNLEPVVIYIPGHAFVGVRQSPGSPFVWPVETTMLGTADFWPALNTGIDEFGTNMHLADVDIKAARQAGVTPIPK